MNQIKKDRVKKEEKKKKKDVRAEKIERKKIKKFNYILIIFIVFAKRKAPNWYLIVYFHLYCTSVR